MSVAAPPDALTFREIEKWFPTSHGPLQALAGFSLSVAGRTFTALVGPSGCGKSTLLHIGAGLDTQYSGEVILPAGTGDVNISSLRFHERLTELLLRFRLEFHAVLIDTQSIDTRNPDEVGSSADARFGVLVRGLIGRGTIRFAPTLDADIAPVRVRRDVQTKPDLPTLPAWSLGLGLGVSWVDL